MEVIQALQEYFNKKNGTKANGVESNGSLDRCGTQGYCCCSRKRDCGTSSHDLSSYIWHTEGDGAGIICSVRGDEDDCLSCRTGSCRQKGRSLGARSQRSSCDMAYRNVCDASTSTFDLSTFVWGTEGDVNETAPDFDEDGEDDDFAQDLGEDAVNAGGRGSEGGDRKRPRGEAFLEFITRKTNGGLAVPPRKKKRRIGHQKD